MSWPPVTDSNNQPTTHDTEREKESKNRLKEKDMKREERQIYYYTSIFLRYLEQWQRLALSPITHAHQKQEKESVYQMDLIK